MTSGLTGYVRYSKLEEYVTLKSFHELKDVAVVQEDFEIVKKNVEKMTILIKELIKSIENNDALNKHSSHTNGESVVENEIKLLKEEKEANNKKIEMIDSKIANLVFEQREGSVINQCDK